MVKAILVIALRLSVYLVVSSQLVNTAPTSTGSWCNSPKNEPFWGEATSSCCNGWMGKDRRCYGIKDCDGFYRCCKYRYNSDNRVGVDRCN